tara:strand:+ start:587 stop:832 length:246 start_codon:yes stop_codon:yes gene_type:complete
MDINSINFTDKAREVFTLSAELSNSNKNKYLDTVHILSSIINTSCLGKTLLEDSNIDIVQLKNILTKEINSVPVSNNSNTG